MRKDKEVSGGSWPPNASEVKETERLRLSVRRAHDKTVHLKLQGQQRLLPPHATALAPADKHPPPATSRPLFTCRRRQQLRQRPGTSQHEEDDKSTFSSSELLNLTRRQIQELRLSSAEM